MYIYSFYTRKSDWTSGSALPNQLISSPMPEISNSNPTGYNAEEFVFL